jgi:hypothetical protein
VVTRQSMGMQAGSFSSSSMSPRWRRSPVSCSSSCVSCRTYTARPQISIVTPAMAWMDSMAWQGAATSDRSSTTISLYFRVASASGTGLPFPRGMKWMTLWSCCVTFCSPGTGSSLPVKFGTPAAVLVRVKNSPWCWISGQGSGRSSRSRSGW